MFENAYHQAARDGAARRSTTILPNARKHAVVMKRARPCPVEQKGCCNTCRDKVTEMNGVEIKGVCNSTNCPLGE